MKREWSNFNRNKFNINCGEFSFFKLYNYLFIFQSFMHNKCSYTTFCSLFSVNLQKPYWKSYFFQLNFDLYPSCTVTQLSTSLDLRLVDLGENGRKIDQSPEVKVYWCFNWIILQSLTIGPNKTSSLEPVKKFNSLCTFHFGYWAKKPE